MTEAENQPPAEIINKDKLIRYTLVFIVMGLYTLPLPIPFIGWEGIKVMPIPGLDGYLFLLVVHEFSGFLFFGHTLFSNIWDISGDPNVNFFTWQYFINYNLSDGWYLTSAPIMTANWKADSGNKWTIPVGGGVGKIFKIGKQNLNAQAQAFYNVEKPENGPDWQLRLQLQFLFPK